MSLFKPLNNQSEEKFAIARSSFALIGVGVLIVIIGFLLMMGGKTDDPQVFNPEIFSFRRITLAPIVVLAGFFFIIWAIMRKPKSE